jgi:hypothetical protein
MKSDSDGMLGVDDEARTLKAIKGAKGKRLMLQGYAP